jgi:hypothetical protein
MNSWDCFDTLVTRKYIEPITIFEEVGRRLNDSTFVKKRIKAEKKSDRTLLGIYKNLPGIDPSIECDIEIEHCFPITKNINKVNDGDYIVSDMYLPPDIINKILKKCGLNKKVHLVVTPDGKRKGYIWKELPKIDFHFGDNEHSDIKSARDFGISSIHVTDSFMTSNEKMIYETDKNLAAFMRFVRLQCPFKTDHEINLWNDQTNHNIPLLILASLELPKDRKICFTYRDCVYWHRIYESLFPNNSTFLDASRRWYYNPTPEYRKYVYDTVKDHMIVDLKGSGGSPNAFFQGKNKVTYIIGTGTVLPCDSMTGVGKWMDTIERLNVSNLGSIEDFKDNSVVRKLSEHDPIIVNVQSTAIDFACKHIKLFEFQKNKELIKKLADVTGKMYTRKMVKTIYNTVESVTVNGQVVNISI